MSIPKAKKPLKIAVLGPAGFGGSYLCVELINRGHHVTGISRSPEKLGSHKLYSSLSINLETSTSDELAEAFKGFDVVIEYTLRSEGSLIQRIWTAYSRSCRSRLSYIILFQRLT